MSETRETIPTHVDAAMMGRAWDVLEVASQGTPATIYPGEARALLARIAALKAAAAAAERDEAVGKLQLALGGVECAQAVSHVGAPHLPALRVIRDRVAEAIALLTPAPATPVEAGTAVGETPGPHQTPRPGTAAVTGCLPTLESIGTQQSNLTDAGA